MTIDSKFGVPRIGDSLKELGVIRNGAIAVKGDKIIFVGSTKDFLDNFQMKDIPQIIDAKNKLVTPGFVDPHTHIIFDGSREDELAMKLKGKSYLEILEAGGGILKTVRATRKASLDKLVINGKTILDTMMEHGTTTIETKSGYGLTVEDEIKSLEAIKKLNQEHPMDIISTFLGAHAIPPEFKNNPDDYVDLIIEEMIPEVSKKNLAEYCDVFCEEGIFSVDQTRRIIAEAISYGLKPQVHVDEIVDTNGALLAAKLGAIQTGHLLKSNKRGLKRLAEKEIIATLLPGTPFTLMQKEYAPARKMIELGVPIALATDLNPNCWTESMQMIITLACYNMKLLPSEALSASTINAACALQREGEIGSLEVGKKADISIFNVPNHQFLPYHFGVNKVSEVIKNGKVMVKKN